MSWAAITSERARATPALPRGDGDGADDHGPEYARGHRVAYRAARKLGLGDEEATIESATVRSSGRDRDQDRGPRVRWAAPVRLVWTATHTPASSARMRVDLIRSP